MKFNKNYFLLTILLFLTEVIIALFVQDAFIRPYVGDVLVVILVYCFIKSFFNSPVLPTAIGVLLFAYAIETLQYLNFVKVLGLQNSKLANIVIGNYFSWWDIVAYTVGFGVVLVVENKKMFKLGKITKHCNFG